jgi:hypothetical protein
MDSNRQEILDFVADHAGVADVSMHWVRKQYAPGRSRLSEPLCKEIRDWLESHNIRSLDGSLPADETARVVLYRKESPIGLAIQAARMEGGFSDPTAAAMALNATAVQLAPIKTA